MKPGEVFTLLMGVPADSPKVTVVKVHRSNVEVRLPSGTGLFVQADMLAPTTASPTHRAGDMATAVAAGLGVAENLSNNQWQVLDALARAGRPGLMDCEHEPVNGLRPDSAGKRRLELFAAGLVEDARMRRETPRSRHAQVWRITALGLDVWQREGRRRAA
jgi:hypothetical protein